VELLIIQKEKRNTMKLKLILAATVLFVVGAGFIANGPWPVPDKYNKMANPLKGDAASVTAGKAIWAKHCQSCHGKAGKGDGSKAAQLKTLPGDFTASDFHKQTDGALFYKTSEGREDMPSFKKKIQDEEEIWSVINYLRTFKK
jgi:mono/diheme cytochrome c family protein